MDSSLLLYLLALAVGILLGLVYFIGLWYTVRRLGTRRHPHGLFVSSFLVRTAIVLAGFYWLLTFHPVYLGLGFLAFIVTRHVVLGQLGKPGEMVF